MVTNASDSARLQPKARAIACPMYTPSSTPRAPINRRTPRSTPPITPASNSAGNWYAIKSGVATKFLMWVFVQLSRPLTYTSWNTPLAFAKYPFNAYLWSAADPPLSCAARSPLASLIASACPPVALSMSSAMSACTSGVRALAGMLNACNARAISVCAAFACICMPAWIAICRRNLIRNAGFCSPSRICFAISVMRSPLFTSNCRAASMSDALSRSPVCRLSNRRVNPSSSARACSAASCVIWFVCTPRLAASIGSAYSSLTRLNIALTSSPVSMRSKLKSMPSAPARTRSSTRLGSIARTASIASISVTGGFCGSPARGVMFSLVTPYRPSRASRTTSAAGSTACSSNASSASLPRMASAALPPAASKRF